MTRWGWSFWWTLLLAPLAVGAIGWLTEKLLLRHVYAKPHEFHILVTVGLALVVQELVILQWGPLGDSVAVPELLQGVVMWGSFVYPKYRLFVIGFTAVLAVLLWWVLEGTRLGSAVRAGSESTEMVSLLGLNVFAIFSLVFALGAATAALAGVLAAPIRGAEPFMGIEALGVAFVIVVVGGLGSFSGALVGGILIGIVQSVMSTLWPEGARIMIYVAMAAVLLLRPHGLLGRKG
ncbi:MAG: branched-chain amino acid ABC transporter permease, partial [Comamonadaceae bacterium]|nr:branched-chain amino acid ABC transporter permease [Comamonadaceae bacterium]